VGALLVAVLASIGPASVYAWWIACGNASIHLELRALNGRIPGLIADGHIVRAKGARLLAIYRAV